MQRLTYLSHHDFFKDWDREKLGTLNNCMNQQRYKVNDIIYDIGSGPDVLYILKTGRLSLITIITIEDQNQFPVGINEWEVQTTRKKIQYEIHHIKEGEIFG